MREGKQKNMIEIEKNREREVKEEQNEMELVDSGTFTQ